MTNPRILVVRNDGPEARGLDRCLRELGFDVCAVAASAAQATRRAARKAPDAAVIDLEGDVIGIEAAERIGNELDIPVVCLTDGAGGMPPSPARTVWPLSHVLKPFDERQLRLNLLTALSLRRREGGYRATQGRLGREIDQLKNRVRIMDLVLDSIEEGVAASDSEGNRMAYNAGARRIAGRREPTNRIEEWPAMHGVHRLDQETLLPPDEDPLARAIRGQDTNGLEVFVRNEWRPEGVHVSVNGRPLVDACDTHRGGVIVFEDISRRKQAELRLEQTIGELKEQEEVLWAVFGTIREGIVVSDESGKFLYVNPAAKELLGELYVTRGQESWLERPEEFFFYPDRATPIKNEDLPLRRAIRQGEAVDDMHLFVRRPSHPNGGIFLWASARPLLGENEEVRGGAIIFRDVTHQVLAEEALAQAFAQGRLEVVDTILHNIGNAINSVTAGTETLHRSFTNERLVRRLRAVAEAVKPHREDWAGYIANDPQGQKVMPFIIELAEDFTRHNETLARTVKRVSERARHIAEIVRTQRSTGSSGMNWKDVDLRGALSEAVDVVRAALRDRRTRIDVEDAGAPKEIRTQESQFHQMMVNVIKNAAQAIQELAASGGLKEPPRIRIRAGVEEEFLALDVSDNGIGFQSRDVRTFFAAGYTTKKSGTGLGLHSAANFVVGSGGRIDLASEGIGKGATVNIRLRLFPTKNGGRRR